ncbi:P-loop containing nucleoside triphosphate hydrolase [Glarea lozoyensis ATCC 20868]|uniref:ATP-dependent DNA helicase n=1 Tax=Glarea lozoyensis (strain ATCC 20868 / MF5171) TaxID=1116229 RepID=S3CU80_GLAL2|nr:P-loop containing nucleoside triphosphate hydrolase [Glarea lozoyensis ATCC 20868]EPE28579.1 P-loop containing nucleoside triphosphate hydrolase [Glarea lozoyensis ATCC 20868]
MGKHTRAKSSSRAYVVFVGRSTGVFSTWAECHEQVHKFSKNDYRKYATRESAEEAWRQSTVYLKTNASCADPIKETQILLKPSPTNKRPFRNVADFTGSEDGETPAEKICRTDSGRHLNDLILLETPPGPKQTPVESCIILTPAQQSVVNLANERHNMFLTGAAGSGKTVTLKEIIKCLQDKPNPIDVSVVAPTGIAALPLGGKTTYSFAGWSPDSFKQPLEALLSKVTGNTKKRIKKVACLIVEEVSMVENQFLERLNMLFQHVLENDRPFGGKQVIFVGDFHQLPPVKLFERCLICGEPMNTSLVVFVRQYKCQTPDCASKGVIFKNGDKWAFKAPVWDQLNLRHVKLEQIHRQKDGRFQTLLNKIRNGAELTQYEWEDLERKKTLPPHIFAIRLMSRKIQVDRFNDNELSKIQNTTMSWKAIDTVIKLHPRNKYDYFPYKDIMNEETRQQYWRIENIRIEEKINEYKRLVGDYHRSSSELYLKVGAKVVLLHNLDPSSGLVNGSQGEVVGFKGFQDALDVKKHGRIEIEAFERFRKSNHFGRPIVHFARGNPVVIKQITLDSLQGPADDRYLLSRTQIPLALAWALSIHKSQGMTLDYAEVSSKDIFESGQLYVGLSRVTRLEGLTVTGFSRKQTEMDPEVLRFYRCTPWIKLDPSSYSYGVRGIQNFVNLTLRSSGDAQFPHRTLSPSDPSEIIPETHSEDEYNKQQ